MDISPELIPVVFGLAVVFGVMIATTVRWILIRTRIFYPIQIRIITTSDWTTLRLVKGARWFPPAYITASHDAEVAEFDGDVLRLTQLCDQASDCKPIEMVATLNLMKTNPFTPIADAFRRMFSLEEPKVGFEIDRGHWGWTHVQLLNCRGGEPLVVENYWWCGITPGERNFRAIDTPSSGLFKVLPPNPPPALPADTLDGKVLFGYQGWFGCPLDGSDVNSWFHWFVNNEPIAENLGVDYWPDMTELKKEEQFATNMLLPNGSIAEVFSSYKQETVVRHFRWMKSYGIDGVFAQRFITELGAPPFFCFRNQVLQNVRLGAELNGRVFALMYDISGGPPEVSLPDQKIKADWKVLVDVLKITKSPNYLRHKGKPVLGIWGIGFRSIHFAGSDHDQMDPHMAADLIKWFHEEAPEKYRATIVAGVPRPWRWIGEQPDEDSRDWGRVFKSVDVLSPWTVNSAEYIDLLEREDVDGTPFLKYTFQSELGNTSDLGQDYLPVVWPGFSWHNLKWNRDGVNYPLNEVKRNGGDFFLKQVRIAASAGVKMLYVAMFDELDEGTAMFKMAPTAEDMPEEPPLVSLDIDGYNLPRHHYLTLGRIASEEIRG